MKLSMNLTITKEQIKAGSGTVSILVSLNAGIMSIKEENKRLKVLCKWIYKSDTARWWMKYEINAQFPDLVKELNLKTLQ